MSDVRNAATAVLAGRTSLSDALELVRTGPTPNEAEQWWDEVVALLVQVNSCDDAGQAADLGEIARAATEPFGPEALYPVAAHVAARLAALHYEAAALRFIVTACEVGDPDDAKTAFMWAWRLDILNRHRRDDEVLALAPMAREQAERSRSDDALVDILAVHADVLERAEDLEGAVRLRRTAIEVHEASTGPASSSKPLSTLLLRLGEGLRRLGSIDEAVSAFEQARAAALKENAPFRAAFALSEIGYTWRNFGEVERGTRLLRAAAIEARACGEQGAAARWSNDLDQLPGDADMRTQIDYAASLRKRDPASAVTIARRGVKLAVAAGNALAETEARNILGAAFVELGATHRADAAFQAAAASAKRAGDLMSQFHIHANRADELLRRGARQEFEREAGVAAQVAETLFGSAGSGEARQVVGALTSRLYDRVAMAAVMNFVAADGTRLEPQPVKLLDVSQRMRGRNLMRWLAVRPLLAGVGIEGRRGVLALRAAEVAVEAEAGESKPALGPLLRARSVAAEALRAIVPAPVLAHLDTSEPIVFDPATLATALRPGECLVDVLSLMDGLAVNVLTPDGEMTCAAHNGTQASRRSALLALRAARAGLLQADLNGSAQTAAAAYDSARAPIDAMIEIVVDEIVARGTFKRVFLCPQTELFALPWWRLTRRLDSVEICVLPVPGALAVLRDRPTGGSPLRSLLAIPDASGNLRNTAKDVAQIPHRTCEPQCDSILAALPGASAVHFGGHGVFDQSNAYYSGFAVRPPSRPDPLSRPYERDLVLLTAAQLVSRVDLPDCELAVLAACRSGIPRQHAANEFTSLPSAFLLAGARAVVASLWVTSDPATALLMQDFYSAVTSGHAPASALAIARASLAAMSREEAVDRLHTEQYVPQAQKPYARDIYTDAFQFYGTD